MSKAITEQGNFMVLGCTGSGKTVFCALMVQALLSGQRSDGGYQRQLQRLVSAESRR